MGSLPKPLLWGSSFAALYGVSYLVKDYYSGSMYEGKEKLTDKVAIVTGANSGIGKEVAFGLAKRDAKVIMACRDMIKCENARQDIVFETKNKYVYCRECDLASQQSIRDFVNLFKKEHSNLHILVNNAGVMRTPYSFTKDGIEMQIGVNHMGHFLLTNLLLDTMKASAPARIVNVSSLAHLRGNLKLHDLNSSEYYDPGEAYAQSKLANVIFTKELAKKLKGFLSSGLLWSLLFMNDSSFCRSMQFNEFASTSSLKNCLEKISRELYRLSETVIGVSRD
ncbi:retinol dehydrogenase 13 [Copidosoma floridanum]|uniref:retinol dehydrogenase 13 n=1 Tax=Copidosoma floridanum TaxID=29053 RepID=UPI000C6F91AC|nr:retinol dehydrogenase 13 [Copidosoma floridanum]